MLILIYIAFFILSLKGFRYLKDENNSDYLSITQCNVVKGFFIILVFLSHINRYILHSGYVVDSFGDRFYFMFTSSIGQLMVVMFLFFSGYGVMESYKKKGGLYIASMPRRRIFTTLLNFDIAVLVFISLNILLRKSMQIKQILLSFIAWESVGNSNWYIFCILVCYLLSYMALSIYEKFFSNKNVFIYALFPIFIFSVIAIIVLSHFKESYWYNTMLCFPFGMLYSMIRKDADAIAQPHYCKILAVFILIFVVLWHIPISLKGLVFNMESIVFAMIIVLIMMKVKLKNQYLQWMGKNLFPLYIYQRLFMIAVFESSGGEGFISENPLLYVLLCFIGTVLLAFLYPKWQVVL